MQYKNKETKSYKQRLEKSNILAVPSLYIYETISSIIIENYLVQYHQQIFAIQYISSSTQHRLGHVQESVKAMNRFAHSDHYLRPFPGHVFFAHTKYVPNSWY